MTILVCLPYMLDALEIDQPLYTRSDFLLHHPAIPLCSCHDFYVYELYHDGGMDSVVQSSPPSLPYNLTIAGNEPNKYSSRPLSPRQMPLPSSPPPVYRIRSADSLTGPQLRSRQQIPSTALVAKLPSSVSKRSPLPRVPPPRPPRPQKSLPNLRPTVILEPDLISALPSSDRPKRQAAQIPDPAHAPSPSPSDASNSDENFSTPIDSPAFFAPRTWPRQPSSRSPTSPLRTAISSTSRSPRASPSSQRSLYSPKWHYENIVCRDSITALPPPPLPPPAGPLPEPPSPSPEMRPPKTPSPRSSPTHGRRKKSRRSPHSSHTNRDTTSSHFIHEVRNAQKIQEVIKANAAVLNASTDQSRTPNIPSRNQNPLHNPPLPSLPELEGDVPLPITVDLTFPPARPSFYVRHRRKLAMFLTALLVLVVTAGILAGILWRLDGRT